MKLCLPVNAPNGLESLFEPHLSSAEHLPFFDTETRLCEKIALRGQKAGAEGDMEIHAALCGSINCVTLRTLIKHGIKVCGTEARSARRRLPRAETVSLKQSRQGMARMRRKKVVAVAAAMVPAAAPLRGNSAGSELC